LPEKFDDFWVNPDSQGFDIHMMKFNQLIDYLKAREI